MLSTNTMKWAFDSFAFSKTGMCYPNATPWNASVANQCLGFYITSNIPSGCDIRAGFVIDGSIYKISANGTLSALPTQTYTNDSILAEGNTVAELTALTNVPGFVGKIIIPVISLYAPADATVFPTFKIALRIKSNQDIYVKTEYSQEFDVSGFKIYDCKISTNVSNGGSVVVEASTYSSNAWSDYSTLSSLIGKVVDKVKFRTTYTVTTIGTSISQLNYINLYVKTNDSITLGTNADLITNTQEFGTGMMYARLLVKHNRLKDANVKAYVNFGDTPLSRESYSLGTGTGALQTITLTDLNIDFSSFKLYANTTRIDFDFNSALNTISFTAPVDSTLFGNYEYGFTPEQWLEMQKGSTQPYAGKEYDSTDFTYSVTGTEKGVSTVRMVMEKPDGSSTDEYLGVGTGKSQLFVLKHIAKEGTITVKQGTQPIDSANWSYDPASKIITAIALKDSTVTATYQWTAETPKILGYVAAWNQ